MSLLGFRYEEVEAIGTRFYSHSVGTIVPVENIGASHAQIARTRLLAPIPYGGRALAVERADNRLNEHPDDTGAHGHGIVEHAIEFRLGAEGLIVIVDPRDVEATAPEG